MGQARKWLVLSPFTGEILSICEEEARRLIRTAGDVATDLDAARARAASMGKDVALGDAEGWMVCVTGAAPEDISVEWEYRVQDSPQSRPQ